MTYRQSTEYIIVRYTNLRSILLKTLKDYKGKVKMIAYKGIFEVSNKRKGHFEYNKTSVISTDNMVKGYFLFSRIFLDDI